MKLIIYCAPAALAGAVGAYFPAYTPFIILLFLLYWLKSSSFIIISLSMITSILFFIHTDYRLDSLKTAISPETSSLTLVITTPFTGDQNKRAVAVNGQEKLILIVPKQHQHLLEKVPEHSKCTWVGELLTPQSVENFHAFDYRQYLFYQNIHWTFKVEDLRHCESAERSVYTFLTDLRYKGISRIEQIFPESVQGIAGALLFGDRSQMEEEQVRMYQRLGVIHLLAISGMHVGMITFFLWKVLLRTGLTRETIRMSLLVILPFYTMMAGAAPPVLRAAGMVLLGLLLQYLFVRLPLLHILCTVFMIHLLLFPAELVNAGFQLSYAVSFTLALSSGKILRFQNKTVSLLVVTVVAQVGALPIIIWHFYELSLSSFLMNLIYVPLYTLLILPSFILIYLISYISMDTAVFTANIPSMIIISLEKVSHLISEIKYSVLITGKPTLLKVSILLSGLYIMMSFLEKAKYKSAVGCLLIIHVYLITSPYLKPEGSVTFINVGQGDSILIQLPYRQGNYLIDTGGQVNFGEPESSYAIGEKVILPYLKSLGVSTIDLLILTHHDWDHIGGAEDLLRELTVKEVWTSAGAVEKEEMKDLLNTFLDYGVPVKEIDTSVSWRIGHHEFEVIAPSSHLEGNNGSLILDAVIGGKKWLFTGDIEKETELEMLDQLRDIDILKVAHHGSNSSTTEGFLQVVKPEAAVISAGKNNSYGHPHHDVLERLKHHGAEVYLTSRDGAVRYTFTGNHGTFEIAVPYNIENKKEP